MIRNRGLIRILLVFICFPTCTFIHGASRLNEYIANYETLDYNPLPIHNRHLRLKRWTELRIPSSSQSSPSSTINLDFHSHSQHFKLRLKRDSGGFSPHLRIEGDGAPPQGGNNPNSHDLHLSHLYSGELEGVPNSAVFGSLTGGVFDGKIITPFETFYVERSHKYPHIHTPNSNSNSSIGHSVIYRDSHVRDPYHHLRTGHAKGCGITDEVMDWMQDIQNSESHPQLKHPKSKPIHHERNSSWIQREILNLEYDEGEALNLNKYSKEANTNSIYSTSNGGRGRRATRPHNAPGSRTTCTLSIQTDPLLWKHIAEQERTNDENKIREEILSLIAQHVKAVNHIYSNTLFDGKETYKNIRFEVQRIKIDTDRACRSDYRGEKNLFCIENIDVSNFLNLHSLSDHEIFCLAYVFTYRDFTGGTLGLAWVASASGASGGVCEKYKTYTETIQGVYQSTKRSLNTGIITFVNYNSRVPPKVSQLTLAHEIGHNFGSPHDFPNKCRPGGPDGNFIMFASATSGDRPNNSKFSECSVRNISSVLDAIIHDNKKHNCFIATNGTFCGNKIVEEGEDCDCGFTYEECEEHCCYPRQISEKDRMLNPEAQGCTRKPQIRCSPSEGPCCDQSCSFVRQPSVLCKQDTECSYSSFCNGASASCPNPRPRADLTPCNDGTQVCQSGECRGSICLKYGLEECFLSSNDKSVDKRKLCELACLDPRSGVCRSTSELNLDGLPGGLSLRPGAPCDNFQGYCDVFLKCRAVDAEGPLARLKNLLFNKEFLLNTAQWVTEFWWAVLLMGVAFIIIMGMFIKCCAVHTPSSNPKKTPHIRIGDTLRRPISTLRRHRNAAYRGSSSNHNGAVGSGSGVPPSVGAPPPYTAVAGASSASGPGLPTRVPTTSSASGPPQHGFGEGRGPKRNKGNGGRTPNGNPYAGAYGKVQPHQQHRL